MSMLLGLSTAVQTTSMIMWITGREKRFRISEKGPYLTVNTCTVSASCFLIDCTLLTNKVVKTAICLASTFPYTKVKHRLVQGRNAHVLSGGSPMKMKVMKQLTNMLLSWTMWKLIDVFLTTGFAAIAFAKMNTAITSVRNPMTIDDIIMMIAAGLSQSR